MCLTTLKFEIEIFVWSVQITGLFGRPESHEKALLLLFSIVLLRKVIYCILWQSVYKPTWILKGRFSSDEYEPLASLMVLNLSNNILHTLKQDVFEHVTGLRVLILSGNPLGVIDQGMTNAISELLLLEELDLSYCDLKSLPDHLFHAPRYAVKKYNNSQNW